MYQWLLLRWVKNPKPFWIGWLYFTVFCVLETSMSSCLSLVCLTIGVGFASSNASSHSLFTFARDSSLWVLPSTGSLSSLGVLLSGHPTKEKFLKKSSFSQSFWHLFFWLAGLFTTKRTIDITWVNKHAQILKIQCLKIKQWWYIDRQTLTGIAKFL